MLTVTADQSDRDHDGVPDSRDACPDEAGTGSDGCPNNKPPTVNAGPDQTVVGLSGTWLNGSATDDGLPQPSRLTYGWSMVSGPGSATFASAQEAVSDVTFSEVGYYDLRLTVSDGKLASIDDVSIHVVDHYRVELQAWIPHAAVVDPLHPVLTVVPWPFTNSIDSWAACGAIVGPLTQSSTFRGDSHQGYDGSYRARKWAEFDWDGSVISGLRFPSAPDVGPTHRDFVISALQGTRRCTEQRLASDSGRVAYTSTKGIRLAVAASNPLVLGAPTIDSSLAVDFVARDQVSVSATTDAFPSHGLRIYRNGRQLFTATVFNASCIPALGLTGATNLYRGLNRSAGTRSYVIRTGQSPTTLQAS